MGETLRFNNWNDDMFQQMCILAGCDYLSFKGIGIKTAHSILRKYRTNWKRAIEMIKFTTNKVVPKEYRGNFEKALLTFRHQTVFCPDRKKLVHLQPPPEDNSLDLHFAG